MQTLTLLAICQQAGHKLRTFSDYCISNLHGFDENQHKFSFRNKENQNEIHRSFAKRRSLTSSLAKKRHSRTFFLNFFDLKREFELIPIEFM